MVDQDRLFSRWMILTTSSIVVILFSVISRSALSADPPALSEIAKSVQSQSAAIESMEVRFSTTWETKSKSTNVRDEYLWMISGKRKLLWMNSTPIGVGMTVPHAWWSFDGEHAYSAVVDNDEPSRLVSIVQTKTIDRMYELMPTPWHFLGHPIYSSKLVLEELLLRPQAKVHAEEVVQGRSCWRIDFGNIEAEGKPPRELSVWLDAKNDYALVKSFLRPMGMTEEQTQEKNDARFVVMEVRQFQSIKDEAGGEDRRFPLEAVIIGYGGRLRYDFASVRLNHAIDRSRFIPRPQIGTEMIVREPGQLEVMTIHGPPGTASLRRFIRANK